MLHILDPGQMKRGFPTILSESLHFSRPILSLFGASCRTRTFSLSVLLQSATVPPQELASIRTQLLRQYISWQDFQPFVQRTFTVFPVNSQKNDLETWCPF